MRPFIHCLVALLSTATAAAQSPPEVRQLELVREQPPQFICSVSQETEMGTMAVQRSVSPAGVPDVRLDSWSTYLAPDGVWISASWEHPDPARYNLVQITQSGLDPARSYRIQVQGEVPNGQGSLLLESRMEAPDRDGTINIFTKWELLTAMLIGAADPRILVIRDDGAIIRSDVIDPRVFARVLAATWPLQPALDATVADYRQCRFYEGGPISIPTD